ncbi:hypothetical protein BDV97DRAFT_355835 [Delphinella strobiligena]|nr:hypothetical protein BDV97DRAFT_355835 [Delphinella strobiligena]
MYIHRSMAWQQLDKQLQIRPHPHEPSAPSDHQSPTTAVVSTDKLPPFFTHNGLDASALRACTHLSNTRFPGSSATEIPNQGFCSHTLIIRPNDEPGSSSTGDGSTSGLAPPRSRNSRPEERMYKILQFRPEEHALPFGAIKIAKRIHGDLVAVAVPLGVIRPPGFGLRDDLGEEAVGGTPRSCNWDGDVEGERQESEDEGRGILARMKELLVYEMDLLPGIAYEGILPRHAELDGAEERRLRRLLDGLARFFRQTWSSGTLPDWLMAPARVQGRVGGTIPWRLWKVANELPTTFGLRDQAKKAQEEVKAGGLKDLPKCLSHGDLLPSNLLVDAETGRLTGVVDWAEAEVLPFGMPLYGIERLLGWIQNSTTEPDNAADESADRTTCSDAQGDISSSPISEKADSVISSSSPPPSKLDNKTSTTSAEAKIRFKYYNQAPALRTHFYTQLELLMPELSEPGLKKQVALARKVGMLLWFGFRWDDGKIDSVINEKDDPIEMAQLVAFLGAGGGEW